MIESLLGSSPDSKRDQSLNTGKKRSLHSSEQDLSHNISPSKKIRESNDIGSTQEPLTAEVNPSNQSDKAGGIFQRFTSWLYNLLPTEEVIIVSDNNQFSSNRRTMTDSKHVNYSNKENTNGNCSIEADFSFMREARKRSENAQKRVGVQDKYSSAIKISHVGRNDSFLNDDESFQFKPMLSSTTTRPAIRNKSLLKSAYPSTSEGKLSSISKESLSIFKPTLARSRNARHRISLDKSTATASFLRGGIAAQESFKLDEKLRYKNLLQNFTSSVVQTSGNLVRKYFHRPAGDLLAYEKANKAGAIVKEYMDSYWGREKTAQLEKTEKPIKKPTKIKYSKDRSNHVEFVDLEPNEEKKITENKDDDIIITKEIIKTSPIKNSLEEKLQSSPFYTGEHLRERKGYYEWKTKRQTEAAESALEKTRQLEALRKNTSMLEDKLSRRLSRLELTYPTRVIEVSDEVAEELPELTPPIMAVIYKALKGGPGHQVVAEKFNIQVTRKDIHTLVGLNWLNDEVINFYMNQIMDRNQEKKLIKVHAFNTFFYPKLIKTGYGTVRRWTKKIDIFSYELLIVPIHLGMHWCLATIDFRDKIIRYYDSMHGDNNRCLQELLIYLNSEHVDKKKTNYDTSNWEIENIKDIPQQMNGSDCGMFSCKFAEYLSRDCKITFSQEHMPYFRQRMIYEICSLKLL